MDCESVMALGLLEIIILGLLVDWLTRRFAKVPGMIGLLVLGAIMGPYGVGLLEPKILDVAKDFRLIALVVILLRAGFEISSEALRRVGFRAVLLSLIPCIFEISVVTLVAQPILGLTLLEAAILGGILAAVSPAVVVPLMIRFIKAGRGAKNSVPTLVLAGASCDDAVAIVLSMSFIGMYVGRSVDVAWQISTVPVSIITGIVVGASIGFGMCKFFDRFNPRATKRVLILLAVALGLLMLQEHVENILPFASLLAIMTVGFVILEKREHAAHEISSKLGKIWIFAQLLLFTFSGAEVNLKVAMNSGLLGAAVIFLGLLGRCIGVQLCLLRSVLSGKERLFVMISYLPKATVQAAIGMSPLVAMKKAGMPTAPGEMILAIAVLSIVLTAPAGAIAIAWAGENLLDVMPDAESGPAAQAAEESNQDS